MPLALLGSCAIMWVAGYSLDNLSLMAFTISVGFVVDDAIVMLENITRHIEEGEKRLQGALRVLEIGFTIYRSPCLWSWCLFAFMMSGIIGRLLRVRQLRIAMTIFVRLSSRDAYAHDGVVLPQERRSGVVWSAL